MVDGLHQPLARQPLPHEHGLQGAPQCQYYTQVYSASSTGRTGLTPKTKTAILPQNLRSMHGLLASRRISAGVPAAQHTFPALTLLPHLQRASLARRG